MTRPRSIAACALLFTSVLALIGSPASATFTKLHNLTSNFADGAYPSGALALNGALLYGFTSNGAGGQGSFFKQTTAGVVTTLNDFATGATTLNHPNAGPVLAGGVFYGTTLYGGTSGYGTIFKVTTTGVVTPLHDFTGTAGDGFYPYAGVIVSGTKLYGTTYYGGANNQGCIYSMDLTGQNFAIEHSFDANVDGYYPITACCEGPDGKLYGTLYYAVGYNGGAIYRMDKGGANFSILHGFNAGDVEGNNPNSDLAKGPGASQKLYGTCPYGGDNGLGTVFSVDTVTGTVALVAAFDGTNGATPGNSYGYTPQSRMTAAASGTFMYGTARYGGASGYGVIFKLDTATNTLSQLAPLTLQAGNTTANPLTFSGTTMYCSSYYGGTTAVMGPGGLPDGYGSSISCTATGTFKAIHSWYIRDAYQPLDSPTPLISGFAYGTAYYGGAYGAGAIYKVNAAGAYTVIHSMNNNMLEGIYPSPGLLKAADGSLYGTCDGGGLYSTGTIFKCTTAGVVTVIHHFRGSYEGYNSYRKLVQGFGTDKNLYGISYYGGPNSVGSVYKVSTAGVFTVLHHFANLDGRYPSSSLTVENNGTTTTALYGGTYQGGTTGYGTLFKLTPAGVFSKLHDFAGVDGGYVYYGGPMVLTGGALYGTVEQGGAIGNGVLFKYVLATSAYTDLHDFNNGAGDGYYPTGGVATDGAGNLYGTCLYGGAGGVGTVWRYTIAGGALQVLHSFSGLAGGGDGAYPYGGVVYDPSGLLYGTTRDGGTNDNGTVFSQTLVP